MQDKKYDEFGRPLNNSWWDSLFKPKKKSYPKENQLSEEDKEIEKILSHDLNSGLKKKENFFDDRKNKNQEGLDLRTKDGRVIWIRQDGIEVLCYLLAIFGFVIGLGLNLAILFDARDLGKLTKSEKRRLYHARNGLIISIVTTTIFLINYYL